jgi:hypothetical protein
MFELIIIIWTISFLVLGVLCRIHIQASTIASLRLFQF